VTLTFELELDMIQMNQLAEYLDQRPFRSKVIVRAHAHAPDRLLYLDH